MFKKITVLPGQSIWDIATKEYGGIDGAFQILQDNPALNLDLDLVPGTIILINPDFVVNADIVKRLAENNVNPATAYVETVYPTPTLIGPLAGNNFTAGYFTSNGNIVAAFQPSQVQLTNSGAGANADTLIYNAWVTDFEVPVLESTFVAVPSGTFESGLIFKSPYAAATYLFILSFTANAQGTLRIIDNTGAVLATQLTPYTIQSGDTLKLRVARNKNVLQLFCDRLAPTPASSTPAAFTLTFSAASSNLLPSVCKVGFVHKKGTATVTRWVLNSAEYTYCDLLCIGDAKTARYSIGGTATGNGFADLWATNNPTRLVKISAGVQQTTADVITKLPELLAYAPKKAVLCIGTEDLRAGVSSTIWQANYKVIVNVLAAIGVDVYHQLPLTETSLSLSTLSAFINATYAAGKIISVPAGWVVGTDTVSGIYPNVSGNLKIYNNQTSIIAL